MQFRLHQYIYTHTHACTYSELTKPRNKALQDVRSQHSQLLPVSRWLTDPANPANNVYASGMPGRKKDTGWKAFAEKVDTTDLKKTADETIKVRIKIQYFPVTCPTAL